MLRRFAPSRWPDAVLDAGLVALAAVLLALELRPLLALPSERFGAFEEPDAVAALWCALILGPLLLRRRAPFASAAVVLFASYGYQAMGYVALATLDIVALVALFSAGAYGRAVPSAGGLAVVGLWLLAIHATRPIPLQTVDLVLLYVVFAGAWVLGRQVRRQREQAAVLAEQNALLERQRELEARQAASDERARVARELHDVIAHGLSVVVVQAEAAQLALRSGAAGATEEAQRALDSISTSSRGALNETRRVLGLLRAGSGGAATDEEHTPAHSPPEPQPGLAQVGDLVERFRGAGLEVEVVIPTPPPALDRGMEVSVYRLVQEALTNTLRHSGARKAWVVLRERDGELEVAVRDDGRGAKVAPNGRAGHGQDGMRERVAMLGGRLEMGPRPEGGYLVTARLPMRRAP